MNRLDQFKYGILDGNPLRTICQQLVSTNKRLGLFYFKTALSNLIFGKKLYEVANNNNRTWATNRTGLVSKHGSSNQKCQCLDGKHCRYFVFE